MCDGYDIIDWKSCESYSLSEDDDYRLIQSLPLSGYHEDISTTDFVFPTLFHRHHETETSIDTIPELEQDDVHGPLYPYYSAIDIDHDAEESVYHKVAHWVLSQKRYFRKVEVPVDDDDLEVIDPVDLFSESVLDQYLLITENESERRVLLRDFEAHRYRIESMQEALQEEDFRFLREPKKQMEIELTPLVNLYQKHKDAKLGRGKRRRKHSESSESQSSESCIEDIEEDLEYLGVPTLLENYVILNREGSVVKLRSCDELWLTPLQEDMRIEKEPGLIGDLDFVSSWFSGGDHFCDESRTLNTCITDLAEKVTVISIMHSRSCSDSDDVWVDAPEIPHWLDDEQEELELFNQPSRPLYYYRDRIKGSYRIIGVEDEKVVLFSENDDDNIFYSDDSDDLEESSRPSKTSDRPASLRHHTFNRSVRLNLIRHDPDSWKNDSGIEDVEDIASDELGLASLSLSKDEAEDFGFRTEQLRSAVRMTGPSYEHSGKGVSHTRALAMTVGTALLMASLAFVYAASAMDLDSIWVHVREKWNHLEQATKDSFEHLLRIENWK